MKIYSSILTAAFLCIFSVFTSGQTISAGSTQNPITFALGNFPSYPIGRGFIPPPSQAPYFKMFWIYGDGSFNYGSQRMYPSFNYNHSHNFLAPNVGVNFSTEALVIDRKTDNEPPARLFSIPHNGVVGLGIDAGEDYVNNTYPSDPIIDASNSCKKVGIVSSHYHKPPNDDGYYYLDKKRETVFAIGFKRTYNLAKGKLFFFYPDGAIATSDDVFEDDEFGIGVQNRTPKINYGAYQIPLNSSEIRKESSSYYYSGGTKFDKTLEYDIKEKDFDIDSLADGIEELRMFHILKSTDQITDGKDYPFMVILGTLDVAEATSCGSSNYQNDDDSFVSNYTNTNNGLRQINGTEYFFLDADTILLKGGEPKDPNSLRVTNISCCDEPNCDDYQVSFELRFLNEAPDVTDTSNIFINDLSGQFYCIKKNNNYPVISQVSPHNGNVLDWSKHRPCHPTLYNNAEARFCIDYTPIGLDEYVVFKFTARTNSLGLNALLNENALEACVEFHEPLECPTLCCSNIPLNTTTCLSPSTMFSPPVLATFMIMNDSCTYHQSDYRIWKNRNIANYPDCDTCCTTFWCLFWDWIRNYWYIIGGVMLIATYTLRRRR